MPGRAALAIIAALALALAAAVLWGALETKRADGWRVAYKAAVAASQANLAATKALRTQERTAYQDKAHAPDERYRADLAGALAKSARHIAANRVQSSGSSPAQPIGQTSDPQSPVGPDPQALVAVTADDVEVCSINYERLRAARDWALGL